MDLKEQSNFVYKLDDDIKESLYWYTDEGYKILNKSLRENKSMTNEVSNHLKNIDLAFKAVPKTTSILTVYKGMDKKDIISDKAFVSTSLYKNVTASFMKNSKCCLIEILVAKGSRILPIFKISAHPEEYEILLDRDCDISITSMDKKSTPIVVDCVYMDKKVVKVKNENEKSIDLKIQKLVINDEIIEKVSSTVLKMYNSSIEDYEESVFDLKTIIEATYKAFYNLKITKEIYEIIYNRLKGEIK